VSALTQFRDSRELLINLTLREVRGKYKRTALGQLWSLINPIAMMAIFSLVFGQLLKIKVGPGDPSGLHVFALWLVCALLPWNFMNNAVSGGMGSLVGNANLIKKVYFPRNVLVEATVLSWDFTLSFELTVLTVALLVFGGAPLVWLPLVVVFVGLLTIFALGLGLALSVANVYFRDTQHFVGIIMQLWFYATPIVYPFSYVQQKAATLNTDGKTIFGHPIPLEFVYRLNPMERFTTVFRNLMYDNRFPALGDSLYCVGAAAVSLTLGYLAFTRFAARVAEEL
jgi:ABC-type polysaccharide/polyol phosphate export permease